MSIQIVQLGKPRGDKEGVRVGTVRRPPRGVKKSDYAKKDYFDVWFPNLAPSLETMKLGKSSSTEAQWKQFEKIYRKEMSTPTAKHDLQLLATLSHSSNFSVGCYCEDEKRCHRSILRKLLQDAGALVKP